MSTSTGGAIRITVTKNRWDEMQTAARKATVAALEETAQRVARDVADEAERKGLIRTGKYVSSWTVERPSEYVRDAISKGAPYGAYLEFGHRANPGQVFPLIEGNTLQGFRRVKTTWVPPRPHARPVAERWKGARIRDQFRTAYERYFWAARA